MTDTDKAQVAALGERRRLGTLDNHRALWEAIRRSNGLPHDTEAWNAWLVDRLESDSAKIAVAIEALEPFAMTGEMFELETEGFRDDNELDLCMAGHLFDVYKLKQFRRARAALTAIKGSDQ
ncbi:hypothetical protein [Oricola thermophila]|uniref:Uncharacterized protein n=1 Tax=Oricola thermophila TaxID=2742145 RepID=A0A6N1VB97_9HYPH|nr:hypothetical protein [Oricola thermophila]QKV17823.1 hypothetical protein HTY61_04800 [Oricola thermophila]